MNKSHGTENKRHPLGRPVKGKDRRQQIGVYIPGSVIDTIDDYVADRQADTRRSYSRSDFINEAIEKHMKALGLLEGGNDDAEKR
jgi:hypothetical protein